MPGYGGSQANSSSKKKETFNFLSNDISQKLNIIILILAAMLALMIYCKLKKD